MPRMRLVVMSQGGRKNGRGGNTAHEHAAPDRDRCGRLVSADGVPPAGREKRDEPAASMLLGDAVLELRLGDVPLPRQVVEVDGEEDHEGIAGGEPGRDDAVAGFTDDDLHCAPRSLRALVFTSSHASSASAPGRRIATTP
jgi:hypothetical protein